MAKERIVATAPIDRTAIDILEEVAPVETSPAIDEETLMGFLANTIALVSRGAGRVTGRMIAACDGLRVIGRPGAGFDTVDVAAASARGIPVVNAPVGAFAVAEGSLALIMALAKRLPEYDAIVKAGRWQERYHLKTGDMAGRTIGIVGLGKIGSHLAGLVQPFEMTVLGSDPGVTEAAAAAVGARLVALDELLACSDYVALHMPLNDETRGLINADRIAAMKEGAILVNLARGDIVESLDVLADALESGRLAGVGLDVFPGEPPDVSHRIFRDSRCLCAPHALGMSKMGMERIYRSMATDVVTVLRGGRPVYCVNPEVLV